MVKNNLFFFTCLFLLMVITENVFVDENSYGNSTEHELERGKVLSRRKRFLTFPDGSSFQLVFCTQTSAIIGIGDIFLFANTAALAWNLPTEPGFWYMFKKYEKPLQRVDTINYLDEDGKIVGRYSYRRRTIVNPAFAKRSIEDNDMTFKEKLKIKIDRKRMHEQQLNRDYLKSEHMDERSKEFHRSNRLELYGKIETLLTALGGDGRQCVLYKLCEAAQRPSNGKGEQGTFLQEFLRIVFTLPKGKEFEYEDQKEYDRAHDVTDDCAQRYPGCAEFEAVI